MILVKRIMQWRGRVLHNFAAKLTPSAKLNFLPREQTAWRYGRMRGVKGVDTLTDMLDFSCLNQGCNALSFMGTLLQIGRIENNFTFQSSDLSCAISSSVIL